MPRIVTISDTHTKHERLGPLPAGDILVHCGDFTASGTEVNCTEFFNWLDEQPFADIVLIAGNHEFLAERDPTRFSQLIPDRVTYLLNEGATVQGLSFWGSPYTPAFCDWAFNSTAAELKRYWSLIPERVNVLMTHGPPLGILDEVERGGHVGCGHLLDAIHQRKIDYHLFGHIHEAAGTFWQHGTTFINACTLDAQYRGARPPVVFDIEPTP
jgi:Icc-related predicted phosphoesterase